MNLEIGDVIQLNDGMDYAVVQKIESNKNIYLYLITTTKPVKTIVAKQKQEEENIILETVSDKEELDYVLYKIGQKVDN